MSYMEEPPPYRMGGIAAIGAYGVSRFLGLPMWLPVILSLTSFWAIGKIRPKASVPLRWAAAIMAGQTLWMLIGGLVLRSQLLEIMPDLIISAILLPWLLLTLSKASALAVIAYEAIGVALNAFVLTTLTTFDLQGGALILHLAMRIGVIGFAVYALRKGMISEEVDFEAVDEVFS